MSRRAITWLAASLLGVCMLSCLVLVPYEGSPLKRALIKLPKARDSRLVGTWSGSWQFLDELPLRSRVTELRSDGFGSTKDDGRPRGSFEWGTENGVLFTRRRAVDSWAGEQHAYVLSPDRKSVSFSGVSMFSLVASRMNRR